MKKFCTLLFFVFLIVGLVGTVNALTTDAVNGIWTNVVGGADVNGIGTNEVRWGVPDGTDQSGFRFDGNAPNTFDIGDTFSLGQFTHFNFPTSGNPPVTSADLSVSLSFSDPAGLNDNLSFIFDIDQTPNIYSPPTNPLNNDIVSFPSAFAAETFLINDVEYTLRLIGFGDTSDTIIDQFSTVETQSNTTTLWAQVTTPVPIPATIVLLGTGLLGLVGASRKKLKK